MNETLNELWTTIHDQRIFARISQDVVAGKKRGATVVIVHGLGVSGLYMVPMALLLARHCRVLVPDLPGFGESSKPSRALNMIELADLLAAWMRIHKLQGATLIGHSMGTQVIVNLILRHPELVERAILVAPTIDAQRRTIHQQVGRLLLDAVREPFSLLPLVLRDYLKAGFRRTYQTFRYATIDRTEEKLSRLNLPTMVIRGEHDPVVPQSWANTVAELIPGSHLMVIQKAAHAVNYSAPKELALLILTFLNDPGSNAY